MISGLQFRGQNQNTPYWEKTFRRNRNKKRSFEDIKMDSVEMSQYLGIAPYYLNHYNQNKAPPSPPSIDSGNSSASCSNSGNSSCDEIDVESVGDDSTLNKSSFSIDNLLKRTTKQQQPTQPLMLPHFYNHQQMLWNPILLQSALTAVNNQSFVRLRRFVH